MTAQVALFLALLASSSEISQDGMISGIVVNTSQQRQTVEGVKVVLEVKSDKDFTLLDTTETDVAGRFYFTGLLVSQHLEYRLAAQHQEIHYPGPRLVLTPDRKHLAAEVAVRDTMTSPNPLVVRRHLVYVQSETGLLRITESMLIDNPTDRCFVGQSIAAQTTEGSVSDPITLRLAVPPDFLKVTFQKEFFGRAFRVQDDTLVTSVPWEPGQRELAFSYVLPNDKKVRHWKRPLDLPTDKLVVRVETETPQDVACTLGEQPLALREQSPDPVFESNGTSLPPGAVIQVMVGRLPVPWIVYARWSILGLLGLTVLGAVVFRLRHHKINLRRSRPNKPEGDTIAPQPHQTAGKKRKPRNRAA